MWKKTHLYSLNMAQLTPAHHVLWSQKELGSTENQWSVTMYRCAHTRKKGHRNTFQQLQEEQCNTSSFPNRVTSCISTPNKKDLGGFWSSSDGCQIHAPLCRVWAKQLNPDLLLSLRIKSSWKWPVEIYRDYSTNHNTHYIIAVTKSKSNS